MDSPGLGWIILFPVGKFALSQFLGPLDQAYAPAVFSVTVYFIQVNINQSYDQSPLFAIMDM